MSDSSKQQRAGATPIKNPLLSASVTGLTFDDFPNKPLLLPAAPPIIHTPPVSVITPSSVTARETKSLVTVGSSSLDTENLDEINLNASNEDNQLSEIADSNANSLLELSHQEGTSDSILSQAASSFSALPSVASNVFSSFSKRINAISSRESTPINDQFQPDANANSFVPQLDIHPTYIQQQPYPPLTNLSQAPPPFYAPPQAGIYFSSTSQPSAQVDIQSNVPPLEPPKFYTPGDVPSIPATSSAPPSNLGGQNNFRFSSKKKLYAPIPGLSDQNPELAATFDSSAVSAPISYDITTYAGYTTNVPYQQISQYQTGEHTKPEERKLGSGLFSKITNFAPTGVLQNITGLVQSAAGSITQTIKPDPTPIYNQHLVRSENTLGQESNYFGGPPPPTNFFVPPTFEGQQTNFPSELTSEYSNTSLTQTPPTSVSFYNSQQTGDSKISVNPTINTIHPLSAGINIFDPSQGSTAQIVKSSNLFTSQQQTQLLPSATELFGNQSTAILEPQAQISFFNPSSLPQQSNLPLQPFRPNRPQSRPPSHPSSSYCPQANLTANDQEAVSFFNLTQPTNLTAAPQAGVSASPSQSNQATLPHKGDSSLPPPASGNTSYRLQKGTKLYKNPLTAQETAPIQVTPPQIPQPVTTAFQTFASQPSVLPATFTPIPNAAQYHLNPEVNPESNAVLASLEPQSVPLFASPVEENTPDEIRTNELIQSAGLFTAASNETKLETSLKSENKIEVFKNIDNTVTGPQIYQNPNKRASVFNPIEPVQSTDFISSNVKDSQPILKTIEPIIELKANPSNSDIQTDQTDPLEQTLEKLSLTGEKSTDANSLTLPPSTALAYTTNNPYRRSSTSETVKPAVVQQPTLANFFTPGPSASGSGDLNFFATLAATEPGLRNIDSGINFFSAPPTIQETSDPSAKTGSFFQTSFTDTTIQAQPSSFFVDSTKEPSPETGNLFQTPLTETTTKAPASSIFVPSAPESEEPFNQTEITPALIPTEIQITKLSSTQDTPIAVFPSLPANVDVIATIEENKEDIAKIFNEPPLNFPPPIGFDNLIQQIETTPVAIVPEKTTIQQETSIKPQQPEIFNRFSNYFNHTQTQPVITKDPSTFFDSLAGQQTQPQLPPPQLQVDGFVASVVTNEEQRIQYFFNNPPPKEASAAGDLNYDLVHSGLAIKNLQQRSLTPVSNLVEPPSSACSEFSELSNSTAGQKSIAADLSLTENIEKPTVKEEKKQLNNSSTTLAATSAVGNNNIKHFEELPEEILKELRMANLLSEDKQATAPTASVSYKPAIKHWFYKSTLDAKTVWVPFSHYDSALLETSLLMESDDKPNIVAVEGGRYDVNISERKKMSVYWESEPIEVRRCSWFYKAVDSKNVPYEEKTAEVLESEYKQAAETDVWHKTIILGQGEQVVFHGPTVIVHFQQQQNTDAWGGTTKQTFTRPRVVKRDLADFSIEQGESQRVDHLLFMVHGIGSACDLKLRSVEEVVEDFRTIARQLVQSHYKNSTDLGLVGRVEVLPISWHSHLHSVEMGIDEKLRMITLESIPKLRNFTNDTLLDILFYTSPTFCQKIMNTIVSSMNDMYLKYRERHPDFNGGVSLAGHSLGSLILFDLLCHQNPIKESEENNLENPDQQFLRGSSVLQMDSNQLESNHIGYTMGPAGTGQPFISYAQLIFQPKKFFALGSPIGMFVTIRGIDKLGLDFRLPTCPGFYNIFHPYDPVAYRIEALVNTDLSGIRPVLIPHHKGRKRMHLELKETMARVSLDLKHRFLDRFKTTLDSVNIFGTSTKSKKEAEELMEKEVEKVIQMQIQLECQNQPSGTQPQEKHCPGDESQNTAITTQRSRTNSVSTVLSDDMVEIDLPLGKLNDSKRIDYVLQEAPLEFINEYIFALSSHVCYWDSEDTILFVMKEIYSGLGISPDSQVPQQTMTIERPSSRNTSLSTL